jgi:hypothetical protein
LGPKPGAGLSAAVDFAPHSANRDRTVGFWRCDLAVNSINRGTGIADPSRLASADVSMRDVKIHSEFSRATRLAFALSAPMSARMSTVQFGNYGFDFARPQSRAERIARLDALANLLDTAFVIPGTNIRFGFDAMIGLVPGIGDAITTVISLYIVREARELGAPRHLVARMLANVAIDGVVGAVPFLGDAFDVVWRANRRNVALLRKHLENESRR